METLRPFTIHFQSTRRTAKAVRIRGLTRPEAALDALGITDFNGTIVLHGGASHMEDSLLNPIKRLFRDGLVPFAQEHHLMVVHGGTRSGTMAALDEAYAAGNGDFPLVGMCPLHGVTYTGHPLERDTFFRPMFSQSKAQRERFPLTPHTSHFILLEEGYFGTESKLITEMIHARDKPGVSLLVNGGQIARTEVLVQLRRSRPVIAITQSGRFANELAADQQENPLVTLVPLHEPGSLYSALQTTFQATTD